MTPSNAFERLVEEWLSSTAAPTIPSHLQPLIIDAARRTPQRRRGLGLLLAPRLGGPPGFAVAAALAGLVIGVAAGINLAPRTSSGMAAPSASTMPTGDLVSAAMDEEREYARAVWRICSNAEARVAELGDMPFDTPADTGDLGAVAVWTEAVVRIGDEAIGGLRALPAPPGEAGKLSSYYDAIERPIDVLRYVPAQARSGDVAMLEGLVRLRIQATHATDFYLETQSSDPLAALLLGCPFRLGA
jgi:hypothetical protein